MRSRRKPRRRDDGFSSVVPAQAGTHNHRALVSDKISPRPPPTPTPCGYGSRPAPGRRGERCAMSRLTLLVCQLLVAVVFLGLWQLFATVPVFGRMLLPPFFFSNPVDVGSQIFIWFATGVIWKHLVITLWE